MRLNPEFIRNLWLEFSLQRLLFWPLLQLLLLLLILMGTDFSLKRELGHFFLALFALITGIWGSKQATASVFDEVLGRTWDWQRMSGLSPWSMTWGKLFGASLYAWYGGLIFLLTAIAALILDGQAQDWKWLGVIFSMVLLSQALGLLLSLLYVRSRPLEHSRVSSSIYLLVLIGLFMLGGKLAEDGEQGLSWYLWSWDVLDFALLSILLFWLWAVLGAYRVMRRELSHSARPWVWLAFLGFVIIYLGGLVEQGLSAWLMLAYLCAHVAALLAILVEPKDAVQLRGLMARLAAGDLSRALLLTPSWLVSLLLAVIALLGLYLSPGLGLVFIGLQAYPAAFMASLLLLFLLRDLAIFLSLSLSAEARRAEAMGLIYLLVLYSLLPTLIQTLGLDGMLVFLHPRVDQSYLWALIGPLSGMLLAMALLWRQWRRLGR